MSTRRSDRLAGVERTGKSVEDHLASLKGDRGDEIRRLDAAITEHMPGHARHLYEGKMWGGTDQTIIGYGIMDHRNRSGEDVEWFVVGLAAQKRYISMYVNVVVDGAYLLREYDGRLGKVKLGSASLGFDDLADVDFENLMDLVARAGESV